MKKLGKLKLNQIEKSEMENREMNNLKGGGDSCSCGCHYASTGGSSYADNRKANWTGGQTSYGGGETVTCSCILGPDEAVSNSTSQPL